ncbi:MAG TPA: hypothetical protein VH044_14490 [Polyangiaceae bacterium]|jgi:hypothetical protein|nr:hypothetical protein [Polyangiaceae bacterium]
MTAGGATAQAPGPRQRRPPPQKAQPKPNADDEDDQQPLMRTEPEIAPPADPLSVAPDTRERIGSDWDGRPPSAEGAPSTQWFPYYERRNGDSRLRLLPPLLLEGTRGLPDPTQARYGVPQTPDTEGLYGILYYRRRSLRIDMDVVFPAFWRVRDGDSHVLVAGPLVHREAPGENDNWLAPLYFAGSRPDGGYFHSLALLTTSHWNASGAFTLVGTYFRDRTGSNVDLGVVPFFFHGNNGSTEGIRRTYTLVPPLLFYTSYHEFEQASTTVAGPLIVQSDPKRSVVDFAPIFFHIEGKPESGGVRESHTTLFPLFHYGYDPDSSLFVLPGYYRHVTRTSDTLLSPFYSQAESRNGAVTLTAAGPVIPLWWNYRDRDLSVHAWAVAPLIYSAESPVGHDWLTPLVGRFETYGDTRTWWIFPTLTLTTDRHGWENDLHPIVYIGRSDDTSHTVVAPVFWDFASAKGRTTIGFPVYWRFADTSDNSIIQVAANTLYTQKRVAGGTDWQFHLIPLFSYGENPNGYFWNAFFGLAGYTRNGTSTEVRAFWIPFDSGGGPPAHHIAERIP